jgi:hypothetical protein
MGMPCLPSQPVDWKDSRIPVARRRTTKLAMTRWTSGKEGLCHVERGLRSSFACPVSSDENRTKSAVSRE